ncbi:MAG TPA: hypothetical protein VET85_11710 [Stellaceae bacterium]|nr:hypothetical protein [Stellaceae bacterium]
MKTKKRAKVTHKTRRRIKSKAARSTSAVRKAVRRVKKVARKSTARKTKARKTSARRKPVRASARARRSTKRR